MFSPFMELLDGMRKMLDAVESEVLRDGEVKGDELLRLAEAHESVARFRDCIMAESAMRQIANDEIPF